MKKHYKEYFKQFKKIGAEGTEHTYRTCFENLLNQVKPDESIKITHEPKRKKGFGAPDFRIEKGRAIRLPTQSGTLYYKMYKANADY